MDTFCSRSCKPFCTLRRSRACTGFPHGPRSLCHTLSCIDDRSPFIRIMMMMMIVMWQIVQQEQSHQFTITITSKHIKRIIHLKHYCFTSSYFEYDVSKFVLINEVYKTPKFCPQRPQHMVSHGTSTDGIRDLNSSLMLPRVEVPDSASRGAM